MAGRIIDICLFLTILDGVLMLLLTLSHFCRKSSVDLNCSLDAVNYDNAIVCNDVVYNDVVYDDNSRSGKVVMI